MQTKPFTDAELRKALFAFQDLMERLQCPFYPLRQTASEVYHETELTGDKLYFGVKNIEWTEKRQSMFNILVDQIRFECKDTPIGYDLVLEGVPIEFRIIKRRYSFFDKPEIRFFGVTEFLIPNPLDKYLKAQYIIK